MKDCENTREPSGGVMIARTYADFLAALSDEEAGRTFKGLIYEFWGCGEEVDAISDNPLVNVLYNSLVQTAKEIDENYQTQREQKREAGKKGGLAKAQKSSSAVAAPSGAKECLSSAEESCDAAKLNKSKVNKSKVKENKENEMKVSESKVNAPPAAEHTPPAAALTEEQRDILIEKYGETAVVEYEQRYDKWSRSKAHCNANANSCISKWLKEDKPENKPVSRPQDSGLWGSTFSAFDIEQMVAERNRKWADDS